MMEPVHMGPSMYLGMILLFILIYNRKLMRTMDTASVLRYAVIVALLGTDQPEGTICTVLSVTGQGLGAARGRGCGRPGRVALRQRR